MGSRGSEERGRCRKGYGGFLRRRRIPSPFCPRGGRKNVQKGNTQEVKEVSKEGS